MALEEPFDVLFDTEVFGVPFIYIPEIGANVSGVGIFDNAYYAADGGEVTVASTQPQLVYETAKLDPAPKYGERIRLNGKDYTIVGIQPDGTGTTTLILEDDNGSC